MLLTIWIDIFFEPPKRSRQFVLTFFSPPKKESNTDYHNFFLLFSFVVSLIQTDFGDFHLIVNKGLNYTQMKFTSSINTLLFVFVLANSDKPKNIILEMFFSSLED